MSAIVFTVYDRPHYFHETLLAWARVHGLREWKLVFRIEPGPLARVMRTQIEAFCDANDLNNVEVIDNLEVYGVLLHPYVALNALFPQEDFVIRAEDDLLPSTDFLEYMAWARDEYANDPEVLTVIAAADGRDLRLNAVRKVRQFAPWLWGTWRDRWKSVLEPTWDKDYSTYNFTPGNESGWDWNINTRLMPMMNLYSIQPLVSRVQNIGVYGVHGTEQNFHPLENFRADVPPQNYVQVG